MAGHDVVLYRVPALAQHRTGLGVDLGLQPDGFPILLDQLVDRKPGLSGDVLDDQQYRLAVRPDTKSVAVSFRQAHVVEQTVGLVDSEAGVGMVLAPLRLVVAGSRHDGGLARHGEALEGDAIDLFAVHRQRQSTAESDVLIDLTAHRIRVIQIERIGGVAAENPGHLMDHVVAGGLVLLVEGEILEIERMNGEVGLPRDDLERIGLRVDDGRDDPVDVGQLLTGGIDDVEVRIALEDLVRGGELLVLPGVQRGAIHVLGREEIGMVVQGLVPGVVAFLLGLRVGVFVVLDVPLLQIMLGSPVHPVGGAIVDHVEQQIGIGLVEFEHHRVVVDCPQPGDLTSDSPGLDLLVLVHVVVLEHEVGRRELIAVGPLQPFPQVQGEAQVVIGGVISGGDP